MNYARSLILQARMGSTRLPGKILKPVLGKPLLSYQIERLRRAQLVDEIIVATTTSPLDDPLIELCKKEGIKFYRGSEEDVLDRYYQAAKAFHADVIIRVTGDCPLIDPQILDRVIQFYTDTTPSYDYVSNSLKLTFPRGLDVEVFSFKNLERASIEAKWSQEREHVSVYFYHHPELFSLGNVECETDLSRHRWTVDEEADLKLITLLLEELYPHHPTFGMSDVLKVLRQHPDWELINAHVKQKHVIRDNP